MFQQEIGHQFPQVRRGVFIFVNAMGTIRVSEHLELLVAGNQFVDQQLHRLIVTVVVAGAMNHQQVALQIPCVRDRTTVLEPGRIQIGCLHVSFLIDRIVVSLIRNGSDRDSGLIQIGVLEQRVQRGAATATPAPHADSLFINPVKLLHRSPHGRCLIGGVDDANLFVDRFSECSTTGTFSASIVETENGVALFAQHAVPKISLSGIPIVGDGRAPGFAIDIDQCRILFRGVEICGPHDIGVDH